MDESRIELLPTDERILNQLRILNDNMELSLMWHRTILYTVIIQWFVLIVIAIGVAE